MTDNLSSDNNTLKYGTFPPLMNLSQKGQIQTFSGHYKINSKF